MTQTDKEKLEDIGKLISTDMREDERLEEISRILQDGSIIVEEPEEEVYLDDYEDWQQQQALMKQQMRDESAEKIKQMRDESAEKIKQMVEKETIRKRDKLLRDRAEFGWSADTFAKARGLDPEKLSKCWYCADYFEELFECDYCKDSYCEEHRLTEDHRCEKSYQRADGIEPSQYNKKRLTRHRGKKGWFLK